MSVGLLQRLPVLGFSDIVSLFSSWFIGQAKLPPLRLLVRQTLYIFLMVFQKLHLVVGASPIRIEAVSFAFVEVVVVVGHFLGLVASLFANYLPPLVIQHPLFSYPLDSLIVFIGLLLLRNGLSIQVLACTVLEVAFVFHFAVRTHLRGAYKSLADIRSLLAGIVQPSVGIREAHHLLEGISHEVFGDKVGSER